MDNIGLELAVAPGMAALMLLQALMRAFLLANAFSRERLLEICDVAASDLETVFSGAASPEALAAARGALSIVRQQIADSPGIRASERPRQN